MLLAGARIMDDDRRKLVDLLMRKWQRGREPAVPRSPRVLRLG